MLQKGEMVGKYKLTARLWEGTFGDTWKAKNTAGESVAIQLIQDENFLQEMKQSPARYLSATTTPSIAQLLGVIDEPAGYAWKFLPGRCLYTFIKELRTIKTHIAIYIARKLLEVLTFTSSRGRVHGAIRPSRVLITPEKRVALTNFGIGHLEQGLLSRIFKNPEERKKYECILPLTFAQEVLEDELFDDPKNDIYSVGIILAEMITGKRVIGEEIPKVLEEVSIKPRLVEIIIKATSDFEERYHHPNQMHQDITRLLKSSKQAETIYVAPPTTGADKLSLEAIPADSEEYRVYQAEVFAAKQAIDAEVVVAEPADSVDGESDSAVFLIPTINKKILDPLEKKPIWPSTAFQYSFFGFCFFVSLACFAVIFPKTMFPIVNANWPIYPLLAISDCSTWLKYFQYISFSFAFAALFLLPWIDPDGDLSQKQFSQIIFGLWICILIVHFVGNRFLIGRPFVNFPESSDLHIFMGSPVLDDL